MRLTKLRLIKIKHFIVLFLVLIFAVSTSAFFQFDITVKAQQNPDFEILEFEGTYDWETTLDVQTSSSDYIPYSEFRDTYCLAATSASACASAANGKKIRIDNAEELYRWSVDVSFEEIYITGNPTEDVKLADDKIAVLLSLDYVLGANIDYSVMQSKAFIPIGFAFTDVEENVYERSFTGTFDGQGFEINRLYVAGYSHLIYIDQVDEITTIDIALSEHYSMFNYNEGTIKNLGLIDANLEILELHTDITKLSNLVGFNMSSGVVQNVYVIDDRTTVTTAGMRYQVGTSSEDFEAAGIVHTNQGTFTDAYYVSLVVMNGNYINKFEVQPVLFTNTGTAARLVYDDDVYLELVTVGGSTFIVDTPNGLATAETTSVLKGSSSLNTGPVTWYSYPSDRYPMLQGYDWNATDEVYEIDNAVDLAFLPIVIEFNTVTYTKDYAHHNYVLTDNIDMSVLASGAYQTPSETFYGGLSGYNSSGSDLGDNYYIYNLEINQGILRGTEYYAGLFSVLGAGSQISNLNFSQSTVLFAETDQNYSYTFFIGALAGKMTAGSVSNVLIDVDVDLGSQALGITYAGTVVGKASGVIEYTSNYGDLDAGDHVFDSEFSIKPQYNIGGVVGAASLAKLTMEEVANHGTIYGIGTSSDINLATGYTFAEIRIGGIIGYISNSTGAINELISVANHGNIYAGSFKSSVATPAFQYIGGVFGKLSGLAPILETSGEYKFANLYNEGNIYTEYDTGVSKIKAAGIGISNTSQAVEYALLFNHGNLDLTIGEASEYVDQVPIPLDLFFSEYVEGSGYWDKAIEIYNPTDSAINLSGYSVERYNGSGTTPSSTLNLSGTLAAGDVYVIYRASYSNSVIVAAGDIVNAVSNFSGDDTLLLKKNGEVIDSFGQLGYDPGTAYTSGSLSSINMTLVRKSTVNYGRTDYTSTFDLADEWVGYPSGTYSYLGSHTMDTGLPFQYEYSISIDYTQIEYTGVLFDVSASSDVTLSRAYNYADSVFDTYYFTDVSGMYRSVNDNDTLIRYSANYGDISYIANSGSTQIELYDDIAVATITTSDNVSMLNVANYGDITLVNLDIGENELRIAGLSTYLSSGGVLENSINIGNIVFAEIDGSGNIYVGGIVNNNTSGDLDDPGQSETQPIATEGIINTINYGNISTTYDTVGQNLYGILGVSNTFAAGIATLNSGSIQDSANLGNIHVLNTSTSGDITFDSGSSSELGGLVTEYSSGVVLGGVAAITLSGDARIYDTGNNGDLIAKSYMFARAGGVLGISLYYEASGGGITAGMGLVDDIEDSVLSNGLNFGNISALTDLLDNYTTSSTNQVVTPSPPTGMDSITYSTTTGSQDRPAIHASAGGVIGYGLSVMQRMLNHGTISSTDVAGGIVGATFAIGGSGSTTVTHITTAINYGDVKLVDTADLSSIDFYDFDNLSSYYMADGNSEIFPSGYIYAEPSYRRGIGGIFGRLQRGLNGVMTSEGGEFDFIVNANPEVDLIGRLDQVYNYTSSSQFFRFNDAIYYSARPNDSTQIVFTGYQYLINATILTKTGTGPYTYTANADELHYRVGIEDNNMGSVTNFEFTSEANYSVGAKTPVFASQIPVPWITEDPSDPLLTDSDSQYIYDPDFPMRTDTNLTEYIYYMTNDLLASRFSSTRPNGMYVLSTSAGQSFGAVIPNNIDLSAARIIDEDYVGTISLLMDYSAVSPLYLKSFDSAIETSYNNLRQTIFNDKAEILPGSASPVILTEDSGGSNTVLTNPVIDYNNKTITYSLSMEAFGSLQTTATYSVTNAVISSYALLAQRAEDYYGHTPSQAELDAFNNLLYPEKNQGISTSYPPDLSVTLPSYNITSNDTRLIGYLSVYSEAFVGDDLFAHSTYYNDYAVYIEFTPNAAQSPGTTEIETVQFNGGGAVTVTDITDITGLGDVNATGSITLNFEDNKGIWSQGYDFSDNFVIKYNDGTIVDESCYSVSSTPVDIVSNVGYYDITFTFNDCTKAGDYYFEYSYFPTSQVYTTDFDKGASSSKSITDFTYYSEEDSIVFDGFTITSYINLETDLSMMDSSANNFSSTLDPLVPVYGSNYTYDIDFMTEGSLVISPFASVYSARLVGVTFNNGYKTYQMEYIIQAEDTTQSTYTHYIIERPVDLVSVLKDGNDVQQDDIHVTREALSTEFTVDLGFDQSLNLYIIDPGAYSYLEISVSGTTNDGLTTYDPEDIVGITYDVSDYLYITFTYQTLPGIYTFSFIYYRDGSPTDYITFTTELVITKDLGEDAYLSDIRFSQLANETSYPDIFITDIDGEIISSTYDPAVYFDGIDYDGADDAGYPYFRIDGRVSNVPLDSYVPFFLDYLPYGATISKYAYDQNTTSWYWTDEADASSDASVLSQLEADFTVYPDTQQEPAEGEFVKVKYRVTAEDGLTQVYYYVTVTDVTYNLSIVFDIYYCTDETQGSCVLANESVDFNNELIIITTKNIDTNGDDTVYGVTDPDDYPTFSVVNDLNNKTTQFYYTSSASYKYKFGRNMAGFYTFEVELPLDQYLNDLYTYEIEYDIYYLNDASDYVADLNGKYFYIEYATTIRTRRFNIYIRPITSPSTDSPYGLFDFFKSWFEE